MAGRTPQQSTAAQSCFTTNCVLFRVADCECDSCVAVDSTSGPHSNRARRDAPHIYHISRYQKQNLSIDEMTMLDGRFTRIAKTKSTKRESALRADRRPATRHPPPPQRQRQGTRQRPESRVSALAGHAPAPCQPPRASQRALRGPRRSRREPPPKRKFSPVSGLFYEKARPLYIVYTYLSEFTVHPLTLGHC